jgi:ABC-type branched-subunit amino acid transport system substrate-binding protein
MKRGAALCLAALVALAPLGARAEHPGDRTGVDPETITLGLHVPFTGGAPLDAQAVQAGASMYWNYLHDDLGVLVHGRRVEVLIEDDKYSPSTAVQKCNEMAASAFMLLGAAGTDQVNACGGFADDRGIPYASAGMQETGLASRHSYYALSPSWRATAPIIAEFVVNVLGSEIDTCCGPPVGGGESPTDECEPITVPILDIPLPIYSCDPDPDPLPEPAPDGMVTVGLVRPNTPNFNDAEDALRDALESQDVALEAYTTVKEGSSSEAQRIAAGMQSDGVDVVVLLSSPFFTGQLTDATSINGYFPRYVMFGMTSGYNDVAIQGCESGALREASTFSPWPAWAEASGGAFDLHFGPAAEKYAAETNTPRTGDVLPALWGLMKDVHAMLEAAGSDPTREDFNTMMDSGFSASTGVYPDLSFAPDDPFGARAVHRLEVDCDTDGTFHQADAFVTGYPAE